MAYKIIETCIGCTACVKRCPTNAITGVRDELHIIDPELASTAALAASFAHQKRSSMTSATCVARSHAARRRWQGGRGEKCIGSGCELCINVCPFDALSLQDSPHNKDFYGMATVDPRKCTGCRLCEQSCLRLVRDLHRPAARNAEAQSVPGRDPDAQKGRGLQRAQERQAATAEA